MDSLITALVILVISGIATLLKKRAQSREEANPPSTNRTGQSRPAAPQVPPRPTSWEEELRRLLEGEQPAAPPPMRPPPPVVAPPPPRTAPTPISLPPRRAPEPRVFPIPVSSPLEVSAERLAPLDESRKAYERASQLDTSASAHITRVAGEHVQLTTVVRKPISAEATQVISLFKSARTARQAVLASIILGPPKGLEEASPLF